MRWIAAALRLVGMADTNLKVRKEVQRAQAKVGRAQDGLDKALEARQASFIRARDAGMSLREIADAAGLHFTRVREVISGR